MSVRWPALLVVVPMLSGCLGLGGQPAALQAPPAFSLASLSAPHAAKVLDLPDGARVLQFAGRSTARAGDPTGLVGAVTGAGGGTALDQTFDVNPAAGIVQVNLSYDATADSLQAWLIDGYGREQCRADGDSAPPPASTCEIATGGLVYGLQHWGVRVDMLPVPSAGVPFTVNVTLRPQAPKLSDPLAGVDRNITFRAADTGARYAGEVNIGVLADGALFYQALDQTMRSKDDGGNWTDVSPPTTVTGTCDPMMRADPWTGRVYTAQLQCPITGAFESMLAWTSDEGATWLANPYAGPIPLEDHEKLAVGPSPLPSSPEPVVYYGHSNPALSAGPQGNPTFVARSLDGGLTFVPAPVTGLGDGRNAWTIGALEADRAGNVYAPVEICNGSNIAQGGSTIGIGVSNDYGQSYAYHDIAKSDFPCPADIDPGVGVDTAGTAYVAFLASGHAFYSVSKDHGATWSAPVQVSLPQHTSVSHVDVVAGDPGTLAIAYRATGDSAREPSFTEGWSAWNMYVAFVRGADGAAPQVRVALVNAPDDPVQRGCVWQYGGSHPCRNLLDFIDIAVGPDGRVYVAYPDGCPAPCPTPADSRKSAGIVGIEEDGPRLFEHGAPWAAKQGDVLGGLSAGPQGATRTG